MLKKSHIDGTSLSQALREKVVCNLPLPQLQHMSKIIHGRGCCSHLMTLSNFLPKGLRAQILKINAGKDFFMVRKQRKVKLWFKAKTD